jgi:hypothetical protein
VLASTHSGKTDPNDARSVAVTALRQSDPREVQPVGHSEVLRLSAKRNTDIGDHRTRLVGRMHALLVELASGGNRQLDHALHMMAICQMRHLGSAGRVDVDRNVAEGKTKREAIRALKRHISNTVYGQLVIDAHRSAR